MFLTFLLVAGIALVAYLVVQGRKRAEQRLADAEAEARRWYERLGGQTMNLTAGGDNPAAGQALADAGERYTAAGSQLEQALTARQFELAGDTAIEGLQYVDAAREAMGLPAGPPVPQTSGQRGAGTIREPISADVEGRQVKASPNAGPDTEHYYPGGRVAGRPVPAGWYSEPWWKTALVAGAWGIGSMMIFDALISPGIGSGAVEGAHDEGGSDGSGDGGDSAGDGGGDYGGDSAGDFGGGDFGGGDFGGF